MRSEIVAAITLAAGAAMAARHLDERQPVPSAELQTLERSEPVAQAAALQAQQVGWGDEVRITAAPDRQFYVEAEVNRRPARFLVDTGASYVALRESDANNAGIYTSWTDFEYPVHTANGETRAALVTIDEIEIDGLLVEGVRAFILKDEQLSINLLGMSFLSRLESVEARQGELILRG